MQNHLPAAERWNSPDNPDYPHTNAGVELNCQSELTSEVNKEIKQADGSSAPNTDEAMSNSINTIVYAKRNDVKVIIIDV